MPVGAGNFLWSRVYVGDVAQAVLAALAADGTRGECFTIVEAQTVPMRLFYEQVIAAADTDLELVRVGDDMLPADLRSTGAAEQHLLASAQKAHEVLGWRDAGGAAALRRSVQWHRNHPPPDWNRDFSADDAALRRETDR
jgi:nucleoside-diphosphate-sugar epimerase